MHSKDILLKKAQFKKFINNMSKIGLKIEKSRSTFPLDFQVSYNDKYLLNFEYLGETLEFYIISVMTNDKGNTGKILVEIERKIKKIVK